MGTLYYSILLNYQYKLTVTLFQFLKNKNNLFIEYHFNYITLKGKEKRGLRIEENIRGGEMKISSSLSSFKCYC